MSLIVVVWFVLAIFNALKLAQSEGADIAIFEVLFAIFLAPIYTFIALVMYFIIAKWPKNVQLKRGIKIIKNK